MRNFTLAILVCALGLSNTMFADEVVIDHNSATRTVLGGFTCSTCPNNSQAKLDFVSLGDNQFETTAGQIWTFLSNQGVRSTEELTLCLDLDSVSDESEIALDSVEFKIESPSVEGQFLTYATLGENRIRVPGYETSSFKAEAKLDLALGYDFMTRFSADSKEKVVVNFESDGDLAIANPTVFVQSNTPRFFSVTNMLYVVGFIGFWVCLFHLLNRYTAPQPDKEQHAPTTTPLKPVLALSPTDQKVMSA